MKKFLLCLLFSGIVFCCGAQTYINPGVDTSGKDIQNALKFYNKYLASFNGKDLPDFSKFWSADELMLRTIPDQQIYAINDNTLYAQGYKATILYIKPMSSYVH